MVDWFFLGQKWYPITVVTHNGTLEINNFAHTYVYLIFLKFTHKKLLTAGNPIPRYPYMSKRISVNQVSYIF